MTRHQRLRVAWQCWFVAAALMLGACSSGAFAQTSGQRARAVLSVWDTGSTSAEQLDVATIEQKQGWKPVASGDRATTFTGDAVITNGRLLAVARQHGTGVEVYSLGLGKPIFRARLMLLPGAGIEHLSLAENSRNAVGVEVASKSGAARFRLRIGSTGTRRSSCPRGCACSCCCRTACWRATRPGTHGRM